ncbi:MAG: hypothetical protein EBZ62_00150, partial [Sphingobacteriia bacterium]|nr:hypothetical protein [Sphingobacteriia bacterium]
LKSHTAIIVESPGNVWRLEENGIHNSVALFGSSLSDRQTDLTWDNKLLTAREAMEIIGTSIFRKLKDNVWVDAALNKIKKDNTNLAIIPDCRFPNEVESIKQHGGYVIRLDLDPFHSNAHAETALDRENYDWRKFDFLIMNSSMSIEEKNKEILRFLSNKGILQL